MKIALCAIAKNENLYIREWVEHYKNIGIDKIFLYDNNEIDGEHFEDVIGDYIESGFIDIIDKRGIHDGNNIVCDSYNTCYYNHSKDYDWICFFDPDEYLTLVKHNTIQEYINYLNPIKYDAIYINWVNYDDNDLIEYDPRPVNERFTRPCKNIYNFSENLKGKSIVKCNNIHIGMITPHMPTSFNICTGDGTLNINNILHKSIETNKVYINNAYLKHFRFKTISEYINKINKFLNLNYTKISFDSKIFFDYNIHTKEKQDIYDNFYNLYKNKGLIFDYTKEFTNNESLNTDITIYTCAFGKFKPLESTYKEPGYKYIMITDNINYKSDFWEVKHLVNDKSPITNNKYVKFHPFEFCDTEYAIYIDGDVKLSGQHANKFNYFINSGLSLGLIKHPDERTMFEEINMWELNRHEKISDKLKEKYTNENFMDNLCYFFCACIMYKNTELSNKFCNETYKMLEKYSSDNSVCRSDQVVIPYVFNNLFINNKSQLFVQNNIMIFSDKLIYNDDICKYTESNYKNICIYNDILKLNDIHYIFN